MKVHLSGDQEIDRLFLDPAIEIREETAEEMEEHNRWVDNRQMTPEDIDAMCHMMEVDFAKAMEKSAQPRRKE